MNLKEFLTIGIIAAFVFASPIAVKLVGADSSVVSSDDDSVDQSNTNTDNDVQVSSADSCLEVC